MHKLKAEEALEATAASVHPFLEASDQRERTFKLTQVAGLVEAPRKPTKADLGSIGIKVIEQE
jgi:hypothetical protein